MPPSRTNAISIILLSVLTFCSALTAGAQITVQREYRGKQISCVISGLHSFEMPCGIMTSYEDIFVGSIQSVIEISEMERIVQITPEEVFLGHPGSSITVTTNQGACFPELKAGDEWLFYLSRDEETKKLLLAYEGASAPLANSDKTVTRLRRLTKMTDSGVIKGFVAHPIRDEEGAEDWTYPPHHKVVARRVPDGTEYASFTDADGHYEFETLPVGSYELTANTTQGLWAEEGRVRVQPHGCSSVGFELHPDSIISGRVTTAHGKPAKYASIEVAPLDGGRWGIETADENGYFEVRGLEAGRYLVGIEIQDNQGDLRPRAKAYYPGVHDKDLAVVINLSPAEKRTHIDFPLPSSSAP